VALKGKSLFSTSTGDEGGTQGGNVITHRTKGKAFFLASSMDVKIEGRFVPRHGDPMAHNCACAPWGGVAPAYIDLITTALEHTDCAEDYDRDELEDALGERTPNDEQRAAVNNLRSTEATEGQPAGTVRCWECGEFTGNPIADHQPPLALKHFSGGCHDEDEMHEAARTMNVLEEPPEDSNEPCIVPHCPECSMRQMHEMNRFAREARAAQGFL